MGAVEVVPGVSGGTIAFVTGIYDELVRSLAEFGPSTLRSLLAGHWLTLYHRLNLGFLLALGVGMAIGILVFARAMQWLLAHYPPIVWATFFGIIIGACGKLAGHFFDRRLVGYVIGGAAASLAVVTIDPAAVGGGLPLLFFAGMLAVCAWLLPAVSGSFVLLMFGQYQVVLTAINTLQFDVLAVLALGCIVGVLSFVRLLAWALARWRARLFNLLLGVMAGSLPGLWPWRLDGTLLMPGDYVVASGEPAFTVLVCVALLLGAAGIWWLPDD